MVRVTVKTIAKGLVKGQQIASAKTEQCILARAAWEAAGPLGGLGLAGPSLI